MTGPRPNFLDSIFAPQSDDMRGILAPEQQQAARRRSLFDAGIAMLGGAQNQNFGGALATGLQAGRGSYEGAIKDQVSGQQYQQQQAVQQARRQISQQYAAKPNESPVDVDNRLRGMLAAFLNVGDTESAGKIGEYLKSRSQADGGAKPVTDHIDTGSEIVDRRLDPATGKWIETGRTRKTPTPAQQTTLSRFGEMTPAAQERVITNTSTAFDRESKDYTKAAEAWSQVDHVLKRAESNTHSPDDIVQLLDGISRLNNPGAVVRTGTVQLQLQKIGSYSDKLRMWISRGAKGAWPTDIVQGIAGAAREIAREHKKQYGDIRKRGIARGVHAGIDAGTMDGILPNAWGIAPSTDEAAPPVLPHVDQMFPRRR